MQELREQTTGALLTPCPTPPGDKLPCPPCTLPTSLPHHLPPSPAGAQPTQAAALTPCHTAYSSSCTNPLPHTPHLPNLLTPSPPGALPTQAAAAHPAPRLAQGRPRLQVHGAEPKPNPNPITSTPSLWSGPSQISPPYSPLPTLPSLDSKFMVSPRTSTLPCLLSPTSFLHSPLPSEPDPHTAALTPHRLSLLGSRPSSLAPHPISPSTAQLLNSHPPPHPLPSTHAGDLPQLLHRPGDRPG